jgi:hypothetical protein
MSDCSSGSSGESCVAWKPACGVARRYAIRSPPTCGVTSRRSQRGGSSAHRRLGTLVAQAWFVDAPVGAH